MSTLGNYLISTYTYYVYELGFIKNGEVRRMQLKNNFSVFDVYIFLSVTYDTLCMHGCEL